MTNRIVKTLLAGSHIISFPVQVKLSELLPKEICGSTIELLSESGTWINKEQILYLNNDFKMSEHYAQLGPSLIYRLNLKREIEIDWQFSFCSYSGLKNHSFRYSQELNLNRALHLAQLSELVYRSEDDIYQSLNANYEFDQVYYHSAASHKQFFKKGFDRIIYSFIKSRYSIVDLQFLITSNTDPVTGCNIIAIVFKGSQEPMDWFTNFNTKAQDFHQQGRVHQGFHHSLELFFKSLKQKKFSDGKVPPDFLSRDIDEINANTKIIIAGHSLGGAIAALAGCSLLEKGILPENLSVYTFGAPPIACKDFCNFYQNKLNIYRFVNTNDMVPKLDKLTKFSHLGEEFSMASNQNEVHSCEGYIDNILDYTAKDTNTG